MPTCCTHCAPHDRRQHPAPCPQCEDEQVTDLGLRQATQRAFQVRQDAYQALQRAKEVYEAAVRVHERAWHIEHTRAE